MIVATCVPSCVKMHAKRLVWGGGGGKGGGGVESLMCFSPTTSMHIFSAHSLLKAFGMSTP